MKKPPADVHTLVVVFISGGILSFLIAAAMIWEMVRG